MVSNDSDWAAWSVPTAYGAVDLRPEREDAGFLGALFRSSAPAFDGLPAAVAEALLDMQVRSQAANYRAAYPGACFAIIERDGKPCGRLIVAHGPMSCVVDYALLPDARGIGLGTAVLAAVLARIEGPVQCRVLEGNRASLAMFRKLGFALAGNEPPFRRLERRPAEIPGGQ